MNSLKTTAEQVLANKEAYATAKTDFDASVRGDEGSMSLTAARDQLTVTRSRFEAGADELTQTINTLKRIFALESSLELLPTDLRIALNRLLYEFQLDSLLEPMNPRTELGALLLAWKHAAEVRSFAREMQELLKHNDLTQFEESLAARSRVRAQQGEEEDFEDEEFDDELSLPRSDVARQQPTNDWEDAIAGFRHTFAVLKASQDVPVSEEERAEYEHGLAKEAARQLERTALRHADQLGEWVCSRLLDLKMSGRLEYALSELDPEAANVARYADGEFRLDGYMPQPQAEPKSQTVAVIEAEAEEDLDTGIGDEVDEWLKRLNRDSNDGGEMN